MMVVGLGVCLPSLRGSSRYMILNEDNCKKSDSGDGLDYIGGVSTEISGGAKIGGGIKITNGPFIPNSMIRWGRGRFDMGVSHNITYWSH